MEKSQENILYKNYYMLWLRSHILRTNDIKKVSDWYEKVFQAQPYFTNDNYRGFEVEGFEFGIFKADIEASENHSINIYWWVDDIQSEYSRILWLWAKSLCEPVNVWGDIMMADLQDPFWNFFGIIYNPNFKN